MKIIILQGSPNLKGSTYLLADAFKRGAESVGHTAEIVQICQLKVAPCTGCVSCGYEGTCVQSDDMQILRSKILAADMIVFATPLYYFGMSAQLKTVIDRFCAFNSSLSRKHIKCALLAVAWNSGKQTFEALSAHYNALKNYLSMQDMGMVLGYSCGTVSMTKNSPYLNKAYELGKNID